MTYSTVPSIPDKASASIVSTLSHFQLILRLNSSMSMPAALVSLTASSIISLGTVAGNILVLLAFFVERNIRTPSNQFILSLAITDLLIGAISMNFYTIYLIIGRWPLSALLCDLWLSLDYTACLTSQYTVLFITVDRFCSVKIPATYRLWRTNTKVTIMIIISWVVPFSIFFTSILGWPYFNNGRTRTDEECYPEFTTNTVFNTLLTIGYFWITLIAMCILYAGIYKVAKRLQNSSEKRRGMSALLAMAGQTMSRIGVGVSWHNNEDYEPGCQPNNNSSNKQQLSSGNKLKNIRNPMVTIKNCNFDSPYKLNAPPNFVKHIPYIDKIDNNDDFYDNDTEYENCNSETLIVINQGSGSTEDDGIEYGIGDILPLSTETVMPKTVKLVDQNETKNSVVSKSASIKITKSNNKSNNSNNSNINNKSLSKVNYRLIKNDSPKLTASPIQRLQLSTRFTFLTRKDTEVKSRNRARKALKTISLILGAFVTCWTPYHVLVLVKGFCDRPQLQYSCVNTSLYSLSYWLCYMNSPINPFCYALANVQIRATFHRLLRGDFRRNY